MCEKPSSTSYLEEQMLSRDILVDMASAVSNPYTLLCCVRVPSVLYCTVHLLNIWEAGGICSDPAVFGLPHQAIPKCISALV